MYSIERYLNIQSAFSPSIGADGSVAYLSGVTGVPQVWSLHAPNKWPTQRTFRADGVSMVDCSPSGATAVVSPRDSDRPGFDIVDFESGVREALTNETYANLYWGGWNPSGDRVAFTGDRDGTGQFEVFVSTLSGSINIQTIGSGLYTVEQWAPGGDTLLVREINSNMDHDLYALDISNGDTTLLTPHDGNVRFSTACWGPNGRSVYAVTDWGANTSELVAIDVETGTKEVVFSGKWNVEHLAINPASGRIAFTRNVNGYSKLHLGMVNQFGEVMSDTVDLPNGVYGGLDFRPDGEQLAIALTSPVLNLNVFVINTKSKTATRWTHASTAGIPESSFDETKLCRYESFDGLSVPAFLTLPSSSASTEPYPLIVSLHGGPEKQTRPDFDPVVQYFTSCGFGVLEPNFRGSTGYGDEYASLDDKDKRMDAAHDVKCIVNSIVAEYPVDESRVVLIGESYGGFLTLLCLTEFPERWAAGVTLFGITNLVTFLKNLPEWRRTRREDEYGSLDDNIALLEQLNPLSRLDRLEAPLLVLHGEEDQRVPVNEAKQIVEKAPSSVPVQVEIFEDVGHGFPDAQTRAEGYRSIVDFLDKTIRLDIK